MRIKSRPRPVGRAMGHPNDIALQWPGERIEQYVVYIGEDKLRMPGHITAQGMDCRYHILDMRMLAILSENRNLKTVVKKAGKMLK